MDNETENKNKGPIVETKLSKSKDGKYVIHRTIITDIKPLKYYIAMIERPLVEEVKEELVI